jgi:hypothetical protein
MCYALPALEIKMYSKTPQNQMNSGLYLKKINLDESGNLLISFGFLSNLSIFRVPDAGYSRNVPDAGYSRNASCALNLISTGFFLLMKKDEYN